MRIDSDTACADVDGQIADLRARGPQGERRRRDQRKMGAGTDDHRAGNFRFYALLLSISEQGGFGVAYLVSAIATIGLISGYAGAILKNRTVSWMVGSILAILFVYLYILLQLEDHALLLGSIGLFAVLSAVMYLTRKIDWYAGL
jgi:hypothetical protein